MCANWIWPLVLKVNGIKSIYLRISKRCKQSSQSAVQQIEKPLPKTVPPRYWEMKCITHTKSSWSLQYINDQVTATRFYSRCQGILFNTLGHMHTKLSWNPTLSRSLLRKDLNERWQRSAIVSHLLFLPCPVPGLFLRVHFLVLYPYMIYD